MMIKEMVVKFETEYAHYFIFGDLLSCIEHIKKSSTGTLSRVEIRLPSIDKFKQFVDSLNLRFGNINFELDIINNVISMPNLEIFVQEDNPGIFYILETGEEGDWVNSEDIGLKVKW